MKQLPRTERIDVRVTHALKRALTVLFESDPEPFRSLSEFVAAQLERLARTRLPQFFSAVPDAAKPVPGAEVERGREPKFPPRSAGRAYPEPARGGRGTWRPASRLRRESEAVALAITPFLEAPCLVLRAPCFASGV